MNSLDKQVLFVLDVLKDAAVIQYDDLMVLNQERQGWSPFSLLAKDNLHIDRALLKYYLGSHLLFSNQSRPTNFVITDDKESFSRRYYTYTVQGLFNRTHPAVFTVRLNYRSGKVVGIATQMFPTWTGSQRVWKFYMAKNF